ncbi:MAG: twin-arginine translocation signal domain-containing protein [Verrucomicrobia bacterium]|nr:twin-arginine translocation signal domain-containing protein [Verrucomicrobiota bacterium]
MKQTTPKTNSKSSIGPETMVAESFPLNRRDFLARSLGAAVAGAAGGGLVIASDAPDHPGAAGKVADIPLHPRDVKLCVKPVMTSLIHSAEWQGPCRPTSVKPEVEKANVEKSFASWSQQLKSKGLGRSEDVRLLEPVHVIFSESWVLKPDQIAKLAPDSGETDVYFIMPSGNARASYEIGNMFAKPILFDRNSCRTASIAGYTLAKGNEAFVPGEDMDVTTLLSLLRARKVFRQTKVLYPTDGVPSFSPDTVWDFEDLRKRLGVTVKTITYKEMTDEMNRLLGERNEQAMREAAELVRKADKTFLEQPLVVRSVLFNQCIRNLMARHGCNAFTIDCFEFCPSRLPQQWLVVPCLQHALFGNEGIASACEADFGILLALRLLMSVSNKSCHQGNADPRPGGTFRINHSAPSMKMNGLNQPDLPYQLGRFCQQGWGTKVVIDFMKNAEKTVTVARVDPTAKKLMVLRGTLVGSSGWSQDLLGCSVEAVIKPPAGRADEFMRRRLIYGNHLSWVYGDYSKELKALGDMLKLEVEVIS